MDGAVSFISTDFMKSIGGSTADGTFFRRAVRTHVPTETANKITGRYTNI
jgi:hypothetical protein